MIELDPDEFAPRGRPPRYDEREDFDDEFRSRWPPAEVFRHALYLPAVAHIVIGVVCLCGAQVAAGAVAYHLKPGQPVFRVLLVLLISLGGGGLFAVVIAGGIGMLRLRNRPLALKAAFIVTGLSIAGLYGILFYPFGIWALILLYGPAARTHFDRAGESPDTDAAARPRGAPPLAYVLVLVGCIGVPVSVVTGGAILWDAYTVGNWSTSEAVWYVGLTLAGACLCALLAVRGLYLKWAAR